MLQPEWILLFLLLGSFVGFMAGLLGIGGGGILVPTLTSIFLLHGIAIDHVVHLALGTSMACMVITSFSSFRSHNAKGAAVWLAVKGMVLGIILGTFTATFLASYLSSLYLGIFFALFMAFVSTQMFLNKKPKPSRQLSGPAGLFSAGLGIGSISALVSIGGGSLTVPYLTWQNIDIKKAIGTSAAIGLPISITGTIGYLINGWSFSSVNDYILGYVYLPAVVLISVTSFITAPYGALLAHKLPVSLLKKVFAVLLIILSIKMLISII
ncbi:sulfite exporter TauE/SafE family protein [Shewanella vesiculosa]|uniref:sulfite exporter TauE/SafE family protein n=1 Tax=Shewanella vesiculosa TaxID=518738 RepID=UPI000F4DD827|nr:sulfite exporter TauE/SafE family protein [Shewanella vesiculosa]RPA35765.1 sulfite exporter TauE/SafE family protein [Shewanella vesiculosa]